MKSEQLQNKTPIKEGKPMKPIVFLSFLAAILLVSCSATRHSATVYDDVYYSPADPVAHVKTVVVTQDQPAQDEQQQYYYDDEQYYAEPGYETPYMETESYASPDGNIVNNYYFYGDYYDYSYASRIRRFHRPMGYSYYHDYYTNMYWYNHDPHFWGTSIYIGYGYYPSSFYGYHGWGWGWPRRSFLSMWYNPYYMYGMGYPHFYHGWYSSYWTGYRHGYWDGYWGYPRGWYYNSFDENSYYYGPRTGFAGNTGTGGFGDGSGRPASFGERYEKALASEGISRGTDSDTRGSRPVTGTEDARGSRPSAAEGTRPAADVQRGEVRTTPQEPVRTGTRETTVTREGQRPAASPAETRPDRTVAPNERRYQYTGQDSRQAPAQTRPDVQRQQPTQTQRQPQPYSPPRYTKPKTSEEFTSPALRSPREATRPAESVTPPRQETSPSQQRQAQPQATPSQTRPQQQAAPSRERPSQPRYTPPSRPSDSRQSAPPPAQYSPPTRSTTPPPSRSSTPSYSPPSRSTSPAPPRSSSPSYSAPSRSSSPPPSRSSSPSISSPSRSSGGSTPSGGSSSSGGGSRSSSGSSGRGGNR